MTKPTCPFERWELWLGVAARCVENLPDILLGKPCVCARAGLKILVKNGKLLRGAGLYMRLALEVNPKARTALAKAFDVAIEHKERL